MTISLTDPFLLFKTQNAVLFSQQNQAFLCPTTANLDSSDDAIWGIRPEYVLPTNVPTVPPNIIRNKTINKFAVTATTNVAIVLERSDGVEFEIIFDKDLKSLGTRRINP